MEVLREGLADGSFFDAAVDFPCPDDFAKTIDNPSPRCYAIADSDATGMLSEL
jgi:hypothetical protein